MNRTIHHAWVVACLLSLAGWTGCGGVGVHTPAGFAELDDDDAYAYRATSAEGVVLAVRREANEPRGNLDFWASAVGYELERKGYRQIGTDRVRLPSGTAGRKMRYRATHQGRPHVYWAAVFVTDDRVFVVEAGGDEAYFERLEKAVDQAVRELDAG